MTTSRLFTALTTVIVGGFVLAGCTSGSTTTPATPTPSATSVEATPSTTPSASETPAPEPTPATPAVDLADPASWVMSSTGLGPIQLGGSATATIDELAAAGGPAATREEACPVIGIDDPSVPFVYFGTDSFDSDVITSVRLGIGSQLEADRPSPTTAEGIGLDSTLAEAQAAYPALERTGEYNTVEYWGVAPGGDDWLVFTVGKPDLGEGAGMISTISVGDGPVPPSEFCG
jgi:hypothetical protein